MDKYCKRLIEVDLPIKRISEHSRRDKSIRKGHISTLHIWWARRPLATCRAVICASLWPDPADNLCPKEFRKLARDQIELWAKNNLRLVSEKSYLRFLAISKDPKRLNDLTELRVALLDFIADFSDWNNSIAPKYLETSHLLTQVAHESLGGECGSKPLILDPFAGGGAIPLEALRVGADSFASDINPVANLLNKTVLEYIPQYGHRLADEVYKWGKWIKSEAENKLRDFYPKESDGSIPIAYIWARTAQCEGPTCGMEIPLMRSLWLEKRGKNSIGFKLVPSPRTKTIELEIINTSTVEEGTIKKSAATCPACGYTTPANSIRKQIAKKNGGTLNPRLIAVITKKDGSGRKYNIPNKRDLLAIEKATSTLQAMMKNDDNEFSCVPDEPMNINNPNLISGRGFGITNWGQLFTPRQALLICTLVEILKSIKGKIGPGKEKDFEVAVMTCLGLAVNRVVDRCSSLCRYDPSPKMSGINNTFARQALPMVWDFGEGYPLGDRSGGWVKSVEWVIGVLEQEAKGGHHKGVVECASATNHPLPDNSIHAFITDPPYYDAIEYGDLSNFFYVWLKRSIGDLHPSLFKSNTVKLDDECIVSKSSQKSPETYQKLMNMAMTEGRRLLNPSGIGLVVFAHKSTSGWEKQLQSMIDAGWVITASWPIDTEMQSKVSAIGQARLMSSVHISVRPRKSFDSLSSGDSIGEWRDILDKLPKRIHDWMPRLADEGVVGADAIFSCLGPALEIFSQYSSVEKTSGEKVELKEYLEEIWAAVSREALNMIFEDADASGFEEDSRLTAMWLWTLRTDTYGDEDKTDEGEKAKSLPGYSLEYDAARKIAQGLGVHLEKLSHLVDIKGDTAMLLSAGMRSRYLFGKDSTEVRSTGKGKKKASQQTLFDFEEDIKKIEDDSSNWVGEIGARENLTTLDYLHQSMILFAAGRGEAMKRLLVEEGVGQNPQFWRLAQAFSALYLAGTDDKRWVDGVLARKKGLGF